MKKEIIVARVNMAGTRIFKSYITNVKLVETRDMIYQKRASQESTATSSVEQAIEEWNRRVSNV